LLMRIWGFVMLFNEISGPIMANWCPDAHFHYTPFLDYVMASRPCTWSISTQIGKKIVNEKGLRDFFGGSMSPTPTGPWPCTEAIWEQTDVTVESGTLKIGGYEACRSGWTI
jgi:hypothetical protein